LILPSELQVRLVGHRLETQSPRRPRIAFARRRRDGGTPVMIQFGKGRCPRCAADRLRQSVKKASARWLIVASELIVAASGKRSFRR